MKSTEEIRLAEKIIDVLDQEIILGYEVNKLIKQAKVFLIKKEYTKFKKDINYS